MNLKKFLNIFNISHHHFAEKIGVSSVSLSRYISGERVPEKKIINRIFQETEGLIDANDFIIKKKDKSDISKSELLEMQSMYKNLKKGSRKDLAKAITLMESSLEKDKILANLL